MTFATDRPVRLAVQVQPQHATYEQLRDLVLDLEQLGVDVVFNWDHFFPLSGDPDGLHFESWTILASIAELTTRVEFGPLVNCNSYRNPDLQADMARTIDHISARGATGRFIFGTGAGWFRRDYDAYGYEFGTAGQRLDHLARALPRIRARWAKLNPPPTRPIPILIGGGGERKTLRLVAQHADIWHSFSDPWTLQHKLGVLKDHCDTVGRNPADIELSVSVATTAPGRIDQAQLETFHGLGVRLFEFAAGAPDLDRAAVTALLRWRDQMND